MSMSDPGTDTGVKRYPTLKTERLLLRSFTLKDAPDVQRLAGERDVARTLLSVPHPYEDGMAEEWIRTHRPGFERGELVVFAVTDRAADRLLGAIGLTLTTAHERAELGYWIGKPYWGRGYATEAAAAVLAYAFDALGLNRVHATHLTRNPASGRVMQKIGMTHEGRSRDHFKKWGVFEDVEQYGILRREYRAARGHTT